MRKLGTDTIQTIIERAVQAFMNDESAPDFVTLTYKGHKVNAFFDWSSSVCSMYVSHFDVVYSRSVVRYEIYKDFDLCSALCY